MEYVGEEFMEMKLLNLGVLLENEAGGSWMWFKPRVRN